MSEICFDKAQAILTVIQFFFLNAYAGNIKPMYFCFW